MGDFLREIRIDSFGMQLLSEGVRHFEKLMFSSVYQYDTIRILSPELSLVHKHDLSRQRDTEVVRRWRRQHTLFNVPKPILAIAFSFCCINARSSPKIRWRCSFK